MHETEIIKTFLLQIMECLKFNKVWCQKISFQILTLPALLVCEFLSSDVKNENQSDLIVGHKS